MPGKESNITLHQTHDERSSPQPWEWRADRIPGWESPTCWGNGPQGVEESTRGPGCIRPGIGGVSRGGAGDTRWLAQVERICREAPGRLLDLGRSQFDLSWRPLHLRPKASWALPAALVATMLMPPLAAHAGDPIYPLGGEFRVNTYTTKSQWARCVAMDADGGFVVVWDSNSQAGAGSLTDVYARRYDGNGNPVGGEFPVNTYTTGDQWHASVAMDADGDFVVAWMSAQQDGDKDGVYARRYRKDGVPLDTTEFQVNTHTPLDQQYPSVAMDDSGDFVVAWESRDQEGPGSGYGVYARRYGSDGAPLDNSEFLVNTHTTGSQEKAAVAMDADGDFVVVWEGPGPGDAAGVFAQRYDGTGSPVGIEFRVNAHTTDSQGEPSVAMDATGGFVVAWPSSQQDGDADGVYARLYDQSGIVQGTGFRVNSYTTEDQQYPSVAMDADGDFVVAWDSEEQEAVGYESGVYAQRYDGDGTPAGDEFHVNTYTTENQEEPSVAMDANGDFVIVWRSADQDGDGAGVYARRYGRPNLSLAKSVNDDTPASGDTITYTVVVAGTTMTATGGVISDTLPAGLTMAGPATLEGSAGTVAQTDADLPVLARGLTIVPGGRVTVTLPAQVAQDITSPVLTNTAAITSNEVVTPVTGEVAIRFPKVYLPTVLRGE